MADEARATVARLREEMIEAANVIVPGLDPRRALAAGALHGHALKLAGGLEAALRCHERVGLYGNAATEDEPGACPHDPDSDLHFEDGDGSGEWLCEEKLEAAVCSSCVDGEGGERLDWPCPEYEAILAALTGKATARPRTPEVRNPDGSRRITIQRCCNGCGGELGDATDRELECAVSGEPLPDVRNECPACRQTTGIPSQGGEN